MRLLIHCTEFPPGPGGIGSQAHALARYFFGKRWRVWVLAPQDHGSVDEISRFNRAQDFEIQPIARREPAAVDGLARLIAVIRAIRRWRPKVVLASGSRAVWVAAMACGAARVPWVGVAHGTELGGGRPWEGVLTRWSFGRAAAVVCVSRFTESLIRASLRGGRQQIVVIPNGAASEDFYPVSAEAAYEFRHRLGLGKAKILLTVGSVTDRKGQDIVIRAMPEILKTCPEVHYVIIGLPECRERFSRIAEEVGVSMHVHFAGPQPQENLRLAYNAADLLVMTSRKTRTGDVEGYGIAVIEGALCGLPAVVSGDCGLAEAVVDGVTGLVVPQEDPQATAQAVVRVLKDHSMRRNMAARARERAMRECTWEVRGREYEQLLRALAEGAGGMEAP